MSHSLARAFSLVVLAYACALAVAAFVVAVFPELSPLWAAAAADVAATVVIFVFSTVFRNSSFYDPYWSVAPIAIAAYWAALPDSDDVPGVRVALVLVAVSLWGVRLTYNWARHWRGLSHEDWRYTDFRERTGALYPLVDLFGIHLFPTVQVFLGLLPVYAALSLGNAPLSALDFVGFGVAIAATVIEAVADAQLHAFARTKAPGEIMNRGLWAYSRHPNYFGEIGFWWGLALVGATALPGALWVFAGAAAITVMFVFVSVPMIDARSKERRPGYDAHMKRVSAIVPWIPKR
jgi:steroid 5-alpha reductase family enzyme